MNSASTFEGEYPAQAEPRPGEGDGDDPGAEHAPKATASTSAAAAILGFIPCPSLLREARTLNRVGALIGAVKGRGNRVLRPPQARRVGAGCSGGRPRHRVCWLLKRVARPIPL